MNAPDTLIVLPVYNEEVQLQRHVEILVNFTTSNRLNVSRILIADNGSKDRTRHIAERIAEQCAIVDFLGLPLSGRGRALRTAWLGAPEQVLAYMDLDLSTDLEALPQLLYAVGSGQCDVAVGSRYLPNSVVTRGLWRSLLSRIYSGLVQRALQLPIRDVQCGFKAISKAASLNLLPLVRDHEWFFDTELIWLAQRLGYRISEIPVKWTDDTGSTVEIGRTVFRDLAGLVRLRCEHGPPASANSSKK